MKQSFALCTVLILSGCATVPAAQAPSARSQGKAIASFDATAATSHSSGKLFKAARQLKKALAADRVHRIETAKSAVAAGAQVARAREKVLYLWSMLPQQAQSTCSDAPELVQCRADAQSISAQFEQALSASDATYDEPQALSLYEASRLKAAACMAPEFDCLVAKFDGFGGNTETHRSMADALKSLEQREQLVAETGIEGALPCLDAGEQQFQSKIAQDYQAFSQQPVLASQLQLHRDYHGLYEAQVDCLQSAGRGHRTAYNF